MYGVRLKTGSHHWAVAEILTDGLAPVATVGESLRD